MSRISHLTLAFLAFTTLAYSANIVWSKSQQSAPAPATLAAPPASTSNTSGTGLQQTTVTSGKSLSNSTVNSNFRRDATIGSGQQQQSANTGIAANGSTRTTAIGTPGDNGSGALGFNNGFNGFSGTGFGLVPNGVTSTINGTAGNYNQCTSSRMNDEQYQQYRNSLMLQGGVAAGPTTGAPPASLGLYPTSNQVSGHVFTGALGEQTTMYPADFTSRTGTLGPLNQQEAAAWNKLNNNRQVYGPQSLIIGSQNEMKPTVIASRDVLVDGIPQRVSGTVIQELDYAPDISTLSFERDRAGERQMATALERAGITTVAEKNAYVRFRSALTRKNHY